jgi:hypothetical protein
MDPMLTRTLETLRKAQDALRSEMQSWDRAGAADVARVRSLGDMARGFQAQAHSALVMMCYEEVPEALPHEVEALMDAFGEIAGQIQARLVAERRES